MGAPGSVCGPVCNITRETPRKGRSWFGRIDPVMIATAAVTIPGAGVK